MFVFFCLAVLFLFPGQVIADDFRLNADGTVRDLAAGLLWQGTSLVASDYKTAAEQCRAKARKASYAWRLPNHNEVASLDNRLQNVALNNYWVQDKLGTPGVYCFGDGAFFPQQSSMERTLVRCVAEDPLASVFSAFDDWADSWRRLDINRYLEAYVGNFTPQQGLSHASWETHRQTRFAASKAVGLRIATESARLLERGRAEIIFIQDYRSATYRDRVRKRMVLTLDHGRWLIESEQQLARLPKISNPSVEGKLVAGYY